MRYEIGKRLPASSALSRVGQTDKDRPVHQSVNQDKHPTPPPPPPPLFCCRSCYLQPFFVSPSIDCTYKHALIFCFVIPNTYRRSPFTQPTKLSHHTKRPARKHTSALRPIPHSHSLPPSFPLSLFFHACFVLFWAGKAWNERKGRNERKGGTKPPFSPLSRPPKPPTPAHPTPPAAQRLLFFFSFLGRALLGRARVAIGVLFVVLFCLGMGSVGGYMITYIHVQHASRRWREPRGRGSGIGGQTPQIFF